MLLGNSRKAAGFTLIELLVVIAIIGVLVGLLLPAVQAARESARGVECRDRLRQFGLAFQQHDGQYRCFPSGGWGYDQPPTYIQGAPATRRLQRAGWGFQVLPFLEGTNVWNSGPLVAVGSAQQVFFCPSKRAPQTVTILDAYQPPLTGSMVETALCDYAAANRDGTGVVRRYDPTRFADVRDGTSNTLLIADKRLNLRLLGTPQDDDNEGYTAGWNEDTIRRTDAPPRPDHSGAGDGDKLFGSSHPGAIYALFADGSVRPISYSVDAAVFAHLGDKNDGQTILDGTY